MGPPTYYNLGEYRREVTTKSPEAQIWFDRGLMWSYSFNHEEGYRCFQKAVEHDPTCAMAYWGIAYAVGPNYNKPWPRFDKADLTKAIMVGSTALSRAVEMATNAQPVERALIQALRTRFPPEGASPPQDTRPLDLAYVEAMRSVYQDFGSDPDVSALFVESLMNLRPRQLWNLNTGEPTSPETVEAMTVIEAAMVRPVSKYHPATCHLYIHLMEMSPNPAIAQPAADRLRRLVPDGSHMQHMATHIDIACGDYRRGVDSNYDAMISDDRYFAEEQGSVLYTAYRTHNIHVMGYAAMISGRLEPALLAAKRLDEIITTEILSIQSPRMVNWIEYQRGTMAHVLIRFGRWEEILKLELPKDRQLMSTTTAVILYARGIAFAVLGRLEEARDAKAEFEKARLAIPEDRVYGMTSTGRAVLGVAALMLDGELTYREGNFERAFEILRQGVEAEDNLPYSDPPLWMQPVRHALGALLLEQNRVEEAVEVYKQDLGFSENLSARKARPNNVWGLQGLYECLVRLGNRAEAQMIRRQHDIAVASADIPVGVSCFCRLSKPTISSCCPS
ncbi:hypothetical protein CHGG_10735 [Chaetomium globosum CBS 148.51]|uniref:MalT-like TPR region domain-containing protein n=1 Tax=Chaetomium globosum (strain ATCC 6205 / CBS 148.51 / DSM 1962 / NBRC 6347 / NRRL 1970) TaxID=306901 RepID=Q2GMR9_CHAGB|nr:uncharacterized protein CHGG_10735 [Chaetomium globosum CBS 148.51]EAQ82917.1 hypothetical protein CHGG_10735 [Chaetomium globosum CBS 148.51]